MQNRIELENIRDMRRREGIEDAELSRAIRRLRVGDLVQVTLKISPQAFHGETVLVRVTRVGRLISQSCSPSVARSWVRLGLSEPRTERPGAQRRAAE